MNFVLWLFGIGEFLLVSYLISRYLMVLIQDKKAASMMEEKAQAEVKRFAS